jgi:hypothetical protein
MLERANAKIWVPFGDIHVGDGDQGWAVLRGNCGRHGRVHKQRGQLERILRRGLIVPSGGGRRPGAEAQALPG